MLGNNIKRKILKNSGDILQVVDIFATIQGEGLFAGYPAIFIRLGGCNLACNFCDTEFEEFEPVSTQAIVKKVQALSKNIISLVVITGGEPFRQPIENLCKELLSKGFEVQVETNGTIERDLPKEVYIMISPKNEGGKGYSLKPIFQKHLVAYKFLLSAFRENYKSLPKNLEALNCPIYIQPIDEFDEKKNKKNWEYVKNIAMESNLILSLQLHKLLNIK